MPRDTKSLIYYLLSSRLYRSLGLSVKESHLVSLQGLADLHIIMLTAGTEFHRSHKDITLYYSFNFLSIGGRAADGLFVFIIILNYIVINDIIDEKFCSPRRTAESKVKT